MLIDILNEVADITGLQPSKSADRAKLLQLINRAASELNSEAELKNAYYEQAFDVDPEEDIIALPWYVYQVRGIRLYDARFPLIEEDMLPRYHTDNWDDVGLLNKWRHLYDDPLKRQPASNGPLTVSVDFADAVKFTVTIIGATSTSSQVKEELLFESGDLSKTTTNSFIAGTNMKAIKFIGKNKRTTQNIIIKDASGNEISFIANVMKRAVFPHYQISDFRGRTSYNCNSIEILYKFRYIDMEEDSDEWLFGTYDSVVANKVKEWWFLNKVKDTEKALLATEKSKAIIRHIQSTESPNKRKPIDMGRNRFQDAIRVSTGYYNTRGRYFIR